MDSAVKHIIRPDGTMHLEKDEIVAGALVIVFDQTTIRPDGMAKSKTTIALHSNIANDLPSAKGILDEMVRAIEVERRRLGLIE